MDRAQNPNSLTLTAGDAYGASPPLSGFFDEEPAVLAMNLMGFDVDTFGNHNFDRGIDHLQQMIDLASFQYVSANLVDLEENLSDVKPFEVFDVGGVSVAVIGDVFAVLPFGNSVVTREVTGAQLYEILEHSVAVIPGADGRFGQISGFRFTFDSSQPPGARIVSVELEDGTPILPDQSLYSFATNDFVNAGGDGYSMLADGQGVTREVMADVVLEYIRAQGTITPVIEGRIVDQNAPAP